MHGEDLLPESNCTGTTVHDVDPLTELIPMDARNLRIQVVFHFVALQDIGHLAVGGSPDRHVSPWNSPALSTQKASRPFDACSFGITLLEFLIGKFSVHANGGGEVTHFVRWVRCETDESP